MPLFIVRCQVDAFVNYETEVWARDAHAAAELARETPDLKWEENGVVEFDARQYVTLDKDGCEIDGTQVGDF